MRSRCTSRDRGGEAKISNDKGVRGLDNTGSFIRVAEIGFENNLIARVDGIVTYKHVLDRHLGPNIILWV